MYTRGGFRKACSGINVGTITNCLPCEVIEKQAVCTAQVMLVSLLPPPKHISAEATVT